MYIYIYVYNPPRNIPDRILATQVQFFGSLYKTPCLKKSGPILVVSLYSVKSQNLRLPFHKGAFYFYFLGNYEMTNPC